MDIRNFNKSALYGAIVSLPLLGTMHGCGPLEVLPGDAAQATTVRANIDVGIAKVAAVKSEVIAVLARFQDSSAGQLLITGAGEIRPAPITEAQVSALYGDHLESSAGVFGMTSSPSIPEINVAYLNGIDVKFSGFKFDAQNNLMKFSMDFSSNNRSINTPELDEVDGVVINRRIDSTNDIPLLDTYTYKLLTIPFMGYFAFVDSAGVDVSYKFHFANTFESDSTATSVEMTTDDRVVEKKRGGDSWGLNKRITYVPTALTGTYTAKSLHRTYNESVNGRKAIYLAGIKLDYDGTTPLGASGSVDYVPSSYSNVKYIVNRTAYSVASMDGGPHTCDLGTSTGSGALPIVFNWTNETTEGILPGQFSCQDAVLKF